MSDRAHAGTRALMSSSPIGQGGGSTLQLEIPEIKAMSVPSVCQGCGGQSLAGSLHTFPLSAECFSFPLKKTGQDASEYK